MDEAYEESLSKSVTEIIDIYNPCGCREQENAL
jgi:hypothetical protein